ncbi:MAG: protein kinase [Alphaproteobacteria bacterium]|nr:protein kinase [Alphaproteobacteria bacterium]
MTREPSITWTEDAPLPDTPVTVPGGVPSQTYEMERRIGEGSMGVVHAAHDPVLGRRVAMKVLSRRLVGRRGVEQRFVTEARVTGQLDHPNVVPVHALCRSPEGDPAYTMKLVDGVNLRDLLEQHGAWVDGGKLDDAEDLPGRLEIFTKICDGVHYAHVRGVVHRDLKPENVMVGRHGEVYVMDWGVAAVGDDSELLAAPTPMTGAVEGTPGFFAPEQAQGERPHPLHDQYALGLVLQELVSLRDAVPGRSAVERMVANTIGDRVPLAMRDGRAPPRELAAVIAKATSVSPADRYADVAALAADVRRYLAGMPVEASPDTPFQAAARWLGRRREWALGALGVLVLLVVVVTAGSVVSQARAREAARARQAALAELVASIATRAGTIDARLARYHGLLGEIATLSAERLAHGAPMDGQVWFAPDFDDPDHQPPDLRTAPAYGQPVSLGHPVFVTPDGSRPEALARTLLPLGAAFRSAARRSVDGKPASVDDLARDGAPIAWISLALVDGMSMSWPGHGDFSEGYDARLRPWYTVAVDATGAVCGAPYVDSSGLGLLLPCSSPVRDPEVGTLLGVASVKLPFDGIIGDLLAWDGARSALLDARGRVVVSSEDQGWRRGQKVLDNESLPLPPYPVAAVVSAASAHRGEVVEDHGRLIVAHPLQTLGWTYVVEVTP